MWDTPRSVYPANNSGDTLQSLARVVDSVNALCFQPYSLRSFVYVKSSGTACEGEQANFFKKKKIRQMCSPFACCLLRPLESQFSLLINTGMLWVNRWSRACKDSSISSAFLIAAIVAKSDIVLWCEANAMRIWEMVQYRGVRNSRID